MSLQKLILKKNNIKLEQFVNREVKENDCSDLINKSSLIYSENGELLIAYLDIGIDTAPVRGVVENIKFNIETRTAGIATQSKIFGYVPRNIIRCDYCRAASFNTTFLQQSEIVQSYSNYCQEMYKLYFPDNFNNARTLVEEKILSDWRMNNTVYTSGIINKDNPLRYHYDAGNMKNVKSSMMVFKRGVVGGYLSLPAYNTKIILNDNTLIIFDGSTILHGVTPFRKLTPDSYRYSIVYYSLRQMWNCLPVNEELQRIKEVKTKRNNGRAKITSEEKNQILDNYGTPLSTLNKSEAIKKIKSRFKKGNS